MIDRLAESTLPLLVPTLFDVKFEVNVLVCEGGLPEDGGATSVAVDVCVMFEISSSPGGFSKSATPVNLEDGDAGGGGGGLGGSCGGGGASALAAWPASAEEPIDGMVLSSSRCRSFTRANNCCESIDLSLNSVVDS